MATGSGFEYVAMPSRTAAAMSVQRPDKAAPILRLTVRLKPDTTGGTDLRVRLKPDRTDRSEADASCATTQSRAPVKSDGEPANVVSTFRRTAATSLYNRRKYANSTNARLKISGIRKTPYTGRAAAPKNAAA